MPKYNALRSKFARRKRSYRERCYSSKNVKEEVYTEPLGKKYGKLYVFYRQMLRNIISKDIIDYKREWYLANKRHDGLYKCELTHKLYSSGELECDHHKPKFRELAESFAKEYGLVVSWDLFKTIDDKKEPEVNKPVSPYAHIPIHGNKKLDKEYSNQIAKKLELKNKQIKNEIFIDQSHIYLKEFKDQSLNSKWIEYHNKHAVLRMIYWKKNRQMM
jgi:hypothetical protein